MKNILQVNSTLTQECTQKIQLEKKMAYQDSFKHHCKVCYYMFSIKKCTKNDCICKPPRLPTGIFESMNHLLDPMPDESGYYKAFDDLYGETKTSEEHSPFLKQSEAKE